MGVLIKVQAPTINALPTMALLRPPLGVPGAGVTWVNKSQFKALTPLNNKMARIQAKANNPSAMAANDKVKPMRLLSKRLR